MVKKYQKNEVKDNLEREKTIKFKLPKKVNVFWGSFGLVSKITDGIAKIIGIHDVGYVKL